MLAADGSFGGHATRQRSRGAGGRNVFWLKLAKSSEKTSNVYDIGNRKRKWDLKYRASIVQYFLCFLVALIAHGAVRRCAGWLRSKRPRRSEVERPHREANGRQASNQGDLPDESRSL